MLFSNKQLDVISSLVTPALPFCVLVDAASGFKSGSWNGPWGWRQIASQLAVAFGMLSVLWCLGSYLCTLSLSSIPATNHCKRSQLFIVSFPTGPALLIFKVAVSGHSESHFQHCQRSCWPNLSSLCQPDISLNINDSFFFLCAARMYQAQRRTKKHYSPTASSRATVKTQTFLLEQKNDSFVYRTKKKCFAYVSWHIIQNLYHTLDESVLLLKKKEITDKGQTFRVKIKPTNGDLFFASEERLSQ